MECCFFAERRSRADREDLHDAALEAMHTPMVHDRLTAPGAEIVSDKEATPEYLGKFVKSEIEKWAVPIKESGVTVE
jgi:tripartite-type tricarboxylate transporter receptor subunit TctC